MPAPVVYAAASYHQYWWAAKYEKCLRSSRSAAVVARPYWYYCYR